MSFAIASASVKCVLCCLERLGFHEWEGKVGPTSLRDSLGSLYWIFSRLGGAMAVSLGGKSVPRFGPWNPAGREL